MKSVNESFFKQWTPAMAYVLGFFYADGYLQHNKHGTDYACFVSTDFEIIDKVKNLLSSEHKIGVRDRRNKNPNWNPFYVLQIGNRSIVDSLQSFGLYQNKSLTVMFPEVPEEYLGDFVRGYFDGDGCVHIGKYWIKDRERWKLQFSTSFTSGSKIFLDVLWDRLKPYLTGGHIGRKKGGYGLVFSKWDSVALFRLMYNNVSADAYLERKYDAFQSAFRILNVPIQAVRYAVVV